MKKLVETMERLNEKAGRYPPKAMNFNKIKDTDDFWKWSLKDARKYSGTSGKFDGDSEIGDVIFFLNMAGAAWERTHK